MKRSSTKYHASHCHPDTRARPHTFPLATPRPLWPFRSGDAAPPAKKPAAPSVSGLQRELQQERDRHTRLQESVEQLRLELQMMGRLLAAAREQIVAQGGDTWAPPNLALRAEPAAPAAPAATARRGRTKGDAKLMTRLQEELAESRGQCRRLNEQVGALQRKLQLVVSAKTEINSVIAEMDAYLITGK